MTAIFAVVAIVLAILLIGWASVELHGTQNLQAMVDEEAVPRAAPGAPAPESEAASSRWATGFSH